jgi:GNAT superfamily N-acetyltransferase
MNIERISAGDIDALSALQPEGWSSLGPKYEYYLSREFCLPVKIVIGNIIAGIGAGISYGNTGWLAHIVVNPGYRKRGIGSAIVNYLCESLKKSGCATISLVATELGFPVYKNAGFFKVSEYVFFKRESALKGPSGMGCQRIENLKIDDILELDKKAFGEDRSRIIERHGKIYTYKEKEIITGLYIPDSGEGMVIAGNVKAGLELMRLRYSDVSRGVLPVENKEGIRFLVENGFEEYRRSSKMILGRNIPWQPGCIFNILGANFG